MEKLDQAREDLRALGASEEAVETVLGPEVADEFEVWPENWPAVQAFLRVQTQWASGMGGPTGLDYTRMQSGLEMGGVTVTPQLFDELRVIECGALEGFAERNRK